MRIHRTKDRVPSSYRPNSGCQTITLPIELLHFLSLFLRLLPISSFSHFCFACSKFFLIHPNIITLFFLFKTFCLPYDLAFIHSQFIQSLVVFHCIFVCYLYHQYFNNFQLCITMLGWARDAVAVLIWCLQTIEAQTG